VGEVNMGQSFLNCCKVLSDVFGERSGVGFCDAEG
jgi:hypothetical protein